MPQQTDSATRTTLRNIGANLRAGHKVRVAGRMLAYDAGTGLAILMDGGHGLLVDTRLSLDRQSHAWGTERLSTIMAVGHLEHVGTPLDIPAMSKNAARLNMSEEIVLRAILIVPSPDLDLVLWNAVVDEDEEGEART